ncbi:HI1506-related protein [Salmonella enterica subsp. enterica]
MNDKHEVFNVALQSTKHDGYRRGGHSLKRGINRLENVTRTSLVALHRDPSILVHQVEPVGVDSAKFDVSFELPAAPAPGSTDARKELLDNDGVTLAERLAGLIHQLTPEQFTQGGVPDVKALSALAGEPITAADRDAAFAMHQQRSAAQEA